MDKKFYQTEYYFHGHIAEEEEGNATSYRSVCYGPYDFLEDLNSDIAKLYADNLEHSVSIKTLTRMYDHMGQVSHTENVISCLHEDVKKSSQGKYHDQE